MTPRGILYLALATFVCHTGIADPLATTVHALLAPLTIGIINGRETTANEYPGVIHLLKTDIIIPPGGAPWDLDINACTGTTINSCVLTAAHCLTSEFADGGDGPKRLKGVGPEEIKKYRFDTKLEAKTRSGQAIHIDPGKILIRSSDYRTNEINDLAVVKIEEKLVDSYGTEDLRKEAISPVDAPKPILNDLLDDRFNFQIKEAADIGRIALTPIGTKAEVVGFGKSLIPGTGGNLEAISRNTQREGKVTVLGDQRDLYPEKPTGRLIALANPHQIAGGDSGGPLFINRKISGVVVGGSNAFSTYASVPYHYNWIMDSLKRLGCDK